MDLDFYHYIYQDIDREDNLFYFEITFDYNISEFFYITFSNSYKIDNSDFFDESYETNLIYIGLGWNFY